MHHAKSMTGADRSYGTGASCQSMKEVVAECARRMMQSQSVVTAVEVDSVLSPCEQRKL